MGGGAAAPRGIRGRRSCGGGAEFRQFVDVVVGEAERRGGGGGYEVDEVFKEDLVAGERERAWAAAGGGAVLLLRLLEQLPEDRVVEARRVDDEPPVAAPHAHCHVPRRHVNRRRRPQFPPAQHLPEAHDRAELATFSHTPPIFS